MNDLLQILQWVVFAMGVMSVYMSSRFILFFWSSDKKIANSMIRMLAEQIITSCCTLMFSFGSLFSSLTGQDPGRWNNFHPLLASSIRVIMFGAMLHSTLHLSRSIREVLERDE